MKKTIWKTLALPAVFALALSACGKDESSSLPLPGGAGGYVPAPVYPGGGVNCGSGFYINGGCIQASSFSQACSYAGGALVSSNSETLCKVQKPAGSLSTGYVLYLGFGGTTITNFPIYANVVAGDTVRVTGNVALNNSSKNWSLAIKQNGNTLYSASKSGGFNSTPFLVTSYGGLIAEYQFTGSFSSNLNLAISHCSNESGSSYLCP